MLTRLPAKVFLISFYLLLAIGKQVPAQTYSFTNYNLKDGLPQSQVGVFYQDSRRLLWLGTFGGLSCFNGRTFTSYSKASGLLSNMVNCIVEDTTHRIIVGSDAGLSILDKGRISNLDLNEDVTALKKTGTGEVWGVAGGRIFRLINDKPVFVKPVYNASVTAMNTDQAGRLYAVCKGQGILRLSGTEWRPFYRFKAAEQGLIFRRILFDERRKHHFFLLSRKMIFHGSAAGVRPYAPLAATDSDFLSIGQDHHGRLWAGTQTGAYRVTAADSLVRFNGSNGFTDNLVYDIFRDAENNIWLSSFSQGIYKFEGDGYIRMNKVRGRDAEFPISAMATDSKGVLWVGTFNKGVFRYNGREIIPVNPSAFAQSSVYFVSADKKGRIWMSVHGRGLWMHDGFRLTQVMKPGREELTKSEFNSILHATDGGIWLGRGRELLYHKDGLQESVKGYNGFVSSLLELDRNRIALATTSGVYLLSDRKVRQRLPLNKMNVLAMRRYGSQLLLATLGDGLLSYDLTTGKVERYATTEGLSSNDIYSLEFDPQKRLWLGTGRGIEKLKFDPRSGRFNVLCDQANPLVIECDQGAILNYGGYMLIGTTAGVVACRTDQAENPGSRPGVHITRIALHSSGSAERDSLIYIPEPGEKPEFRSDHNHLSIRFEGVFLTNPASVRYQYMLVGSDDGFNQPVTNEEVEYSNLKPGHYVFRVRALAGGKASGIHEFAFYVVPAFYETWWFATSVALAAVLLIYAGLRLYFKRKERKRRQLESITRAEKQRIRTQTAEDFHDDIGNKLTRITVLSEILDQKLEPEDSERKELVRLIRQNAGLLYSGTKDILWALDPKSDNLLEILNHVADVGQELFAHTGIVFQMEGCNEQYRKVRLSMEVNRNLSLIFKEILNNILKHAAARHVRIRVVKTAQNTLNLETEDDGAGFDTRSAARGNGLRNIRVRCERIHSELSICSTPGKGTKITISTKIRVTN
ncbi:sensor histidine kinase [Pedobacter yulinensis]|nr:sensor histidine kinase [Pedobacter yulinensis]